MISLIRLVRVNREERNRYSSRTFTTHCRWQNLTVEIHSMAPGFVLCRCTSGNPRAMDEEVDENEEKHADGKHMFKVFCCLPQDIEFQGRDWTWSPDRCYRPDMSLQRKCTRNLWTKALRIATWSGGCCRILWACVHVSSIVILGVVKRIFPVFGARTYRIRSSILSSANVHCWNSATREWGSPWLNLETWLYEFHLDTMRHQCAEDLD